MSKSEMNLEQEMENFFMSIFNQNNKSSHNEVTAFTNNNKNILTERDQNRQSNRDQKQQQPNSNRHLNYDEFKQTHDEFKQKLLNYIREKQITIDELEKRNKQLDIQLEEAKKLVSSMNQSQSHLKNYFKGIVDKEQEYKLKIVQLTNLVEQKQLAIKSLKQIFKGFNDKEQEYKLKIDQLSNLVEEKQQTVTSLEQVLGQYEKILRNLLEDLMYGGKEQKEKVTELNNLVKKKEHAVKSLEQILIQYEKSIRNLIKDQIQGSSNSKFNQIFLNQTNLTKQYSNQFIKLNKGLKEFQHKIESKVKIIVQESQGKNKQSNNHIIQLKDILGQQNREKEILRENIIEISFLLFNQGNGYLQNFIKLSQHCLQQDDPKKDFNLNEIQQTMEKIEVIHKEFIEFINQIYSQNISVEKTCEKIKEFISKFIEECKILQDTVLKGISYKQT